MNVLRPGAPNLFGTALDPAIDVAGQKNESVARPHSESQPTLVSLFEAQVGRAPEAIAVVCAGQSLTYQVLDARANRLAWCLIEKGIGPQDAVALHLPRGLDMVVG